MAEKTETFDVVICSKRTGEIFAVVAATLETKQGHALRKSCEARIVPAGKFKVGQMMKGEIPNPEPSESQLVAGLPR